jgi:hypothetical protein
MSSKYINAKLVAKYRQILLGNYRFLIFSNQLKMAANNGVETFSFSDIRLFTS